ncbi:1,4-dihydroxy-2-naphthoate octaprenyltransferase [Teredinibacter turnerae]|uniref:1,4-dihydroxy-2-naphthoate octaprenyltransferase n=1 Tax=Teredinibacter turnerae TaxID=2426 RepID=UPI0003738F97|nr:1,4-dihydroxy-2-naphthoate octaprenyltransferase [Teredinibacter turnerae]
MNTSASITQSPSKLTVFLLAIRPRTLPASLSPVVLGTALVPASQFNWAIALCALGVALFLQIAVNLANDYFDAKSGIDTTARLGPIRVTQSNLAPAQIVALGVALFLCLATFCGLALVIHTGWPLLVVGLICILATLAYSGGPYPLASHALGEITVLIFFGWVAVLGSYYVHTQSLSPQVFWLSNALGLVLAAIMLVNNLRDIKTDRIARKYTLAVLLGDSCSRLLYTTLVIAAAFAHIVGFSFAAEDPHLSEMFLPLLVCLPSGYFCCRDARRLQGRELNRLLGSTALLGLLYAGTTALLHLLFR